MTRISIRLYVELAVLSLTALTLLGTSIAFADANTGTQGQPNQSCQSVFPTGPLSPNGFNTGGFAKAGTVYAGTGSNTNTPANSNAVSQYDVACYQVGQHR
ncbi:MAG: hypothetical protein ACHQ1H_03245 [Nitrososphaerales archaeon]